MNRMKLAIPIVLLASACTTVKVLQIKFDKGGVVRGYNWSGGS